MSHGTGTHTDWHWLAQTDWHTYNSEEKKVQPVMGPILQDSKVVETSSVQH